VVSCVGTARFAILFIRRGNVMKDNVLKGPITITDDWISEGKQCYEYYLNTSCCKGTYEVWRKNAKEWFFLHNSDRMLPAMAKRLEDLRKDYEGI
jgi:hypothetical protein